MSAVAMYYNMSILSSATGEPVRREETGQQIGATGSKVVRFNTNTNTLNSWWLEFNGVVWTEYERDNLDAQNFIFEITVDESIIKLVWLENQ